MQRRTLGSQWWLSFAIGYTLLALANLTIGIVGSWTTPKIVVDAVWFALAVAAFVAWRRQYRREGRAAR